MWFSCRANEFTDLVELALEAIADSAETFDASREKYKKINARLDVVMPGFGAREEQHQKVFNCIKEISLFLRAK